MTLFARLKARLRRESADPAVAAPPPRRRRAPKITREVELVLLRCPVCKERFRAEHGSFTPNHADPTGEEPCDGVGEPLVDRKPTS